MRVILALAVALVVASPAYADHGKRYTWPTTELVVEDALEGGHRKVRAAVGKWNRGTPFDNTLIRNRDNCEGIPERGRVTICDWGFRRVARFCGWPVQSTSGACVDDDWLSNDQVWGAHIVIKSWIVRRGGSRLSYLLCHEIGHALGLNHQWVPSSCMGANKDALYPNYHDQETLKGIVRVSDQLVFEDLKESERLKAVQAIRPSSSFTRFPLTIGALRGA